MRDAHGSCRNGLYAIDASEERMDSGEKGSECVSASKGKAECPLWCPNQDQPPLLKVTYRVKDLSQYVFLSHLG